MKKKNNYFVTALTAIVVLIAFIAINISPLLSSINLGLDLKGGFEVLYEVEPIEAGDELTDDMINSTIDIISRRVNEFGLSEPVITREGDKIRIQLAGVEDQTSARELLSKTATLTFRDTNDNLLMDSSVLDSGRAKRDFQNGRNVVSLSIADNDKFYEKTKEVSNYVDNRMVIWLDFDDEINSFEEEERNKTCGTENSRCIMAAYVNQAHSTNVIIQGSFTTEEADQLATLINAGSLPTKLTELYSTSVGASLGMQALEKTMLAGIIGISLVLIFMTVFYRFVGFIASISLIVYSYIVFLLFYLMGGTLTLPGIAAMVLGVGMAVDANVITFERIKEELLEGRSLTAAFKAGNKKSFLTIVDANITTFLVAIVLFIFGQSSVKGFATMLMISIFATFLVTIFLTRAILSLLVKSNKFNDKLLFFVNVKKEDIRNLSKNEKPKEHKFSKLDFISNRLKFFTISGLIILVGLLSSFIKGPNLGIDFVSGSIITASIEKDQMDDFIEDLSIFNYEVKSSSYIDSEGIANIRINHVLDQREEKKIKELATTNYLTKVNIEKVSPVVGKMIVNNAIYSMLIASIGIIIYITLRFRSSYAFAAITALLHDALFVVALFIIFRLEISAVFIAAILAILGYSINDTIVAFDRIRENIKLTEKEKLEYDDLKMIVNKSLQQTLVRSLNTTVTALLPVLALVVLGSSSIFGFNLALFIGLIAGTYSSIFIAAQVWLEIEKKNINKNNGEKKKSKWFDLSDEEHESSFEGINN